MNIYSLITRIVFNNSKVSQFVATSIKNEKIQERVFLQIDHSYRTEITNHQWILCQIPFILGTWLINTPSITLSDTLLFSLTITSQDAKIIYCSAELRFFDKLNFADGTLVLLSFRKANSFQLNSIKRFMLLRTFRSQRMQELTLEELEFFAVGFSYPRKVILAVYFDQAYHNFFPMDFQGYISEAGFQLLGLRKTNITLTKIEHDKKILVCDVEGCEKESLYRWGKHHSSKPLSFDSIELQDERSLHFNFPVPKIAKSYKEVQILKSHDLGSHMLFVGKVIYNHVYDHLESPMYHLHFFQLTKNLEQKNLLYSKID